MNANNHRLFALYLLSIVAALLHTDPAAGDERRFPLEGVVQSPTKDGLALRKEPPTATAFSYKLGDRICGLANGTEFIATEQSFVANGEIWFRVQTTRIVNFAGKRCPVDTVSGWLVAKTTRDWTITIVEQDVALVDSPSKPSEQASSEGAQEVVERQPSTPLYYLWVSLGTVVAACVLSIRKADSLKRSEWMSPKLGLECAVLSAVNIWIVAALLDQLVVDEPNFMFTLLRLFQRMVWGPALLGFLLSVLLLRFVSFAEPKAA